MEKYSSIFVFAALGLLIFTLARTRRRIKQLEKERQKAFSIKREPVEDYNEAKVVKLVDVCRELEARVQNSASLLEALIDDADNRIALLKETKDKEPVKEKKVEVNNEMYDRVLALSKEGKSEEEIGVLLNRSKGEVELLLSLGKKSQSES
jgi:hypothetical protein